jgi:hypothetical protein
VTSASNKRVLRSAFSIGPQPFVEAYECTRNLSL